MSPKELEREMLFSEDDSWEYIEALGYEYYQNAPEPGDAGILARAVEKARLFCIDHNILYTRDFLEATVHKVWDGNIDAGGN